MLESGSSGSVRGASRNGRPYRELGKKRGLAAQMAVEKFREPDYEPVPVVINGGSY